MWAAFLLACTLSGEEARPSSLPLHGHPSLFQHIPPPSSPGTIWAQTAGRNSRSSRKGNIKMSTFSPVHRWRCPTTYWHFLNIKCFKFMSSGMAHSDVQGSLPGHDSAPGALPFEWFQVIFIPEYITWPSSVWKVICHSVPTPRFISASWSLAPAVWHFTSWKKLIPFPNYMAKKKYLLGNREILLRLDLLIASKLPKIWAMLMT